VAAKSFSTTFLFTMHTVFELAPLARGYDWSKAVAFSVAPAAPTFAAIYFFAGDDLLLASLVTGAAFFAIFLCALSLARDPLGRVTLTADALLLDSGQLHSRIPLADLDLAQARSGLPATGISTRHRLVTNPAHAVTLALRAGGDPICLSPLEHARFLTALRSRTA
jgi:hypothetical protein